MDFRDVNGGYSYFRPNETANLRDKTVQGDINVRVKDGYVGNMLSTEGTTTLIMSDYDDTKPTPPEIRLYRSTSSPVYAEYRGTQLSLIDTLRSRSQQQPTTSPSLKSRVQQEIINEPTPVVSKIAGTMIRCRKCGKNSNAMGVSKGKIPSVRNTLNGAILTDPLNQEHIISNDGVYQLIEDGDGHYKIEWKGMHC